MFHLLAQLVDGRVAGSTDQHWSTVLLDELVQDRGGGHRLASARGALGTFRSFQEIQEVFQEWRQPDLDEAERSLERVLDSVHLAPVEVRQVGGAEVTRKLEQGVRSFRVTD